MTAPILNQLSEKPDKQDRVFRLLFWGMAVVLLLLMMALVPDYGSSGDELSRYQYGKSVLHFYTGIDAGNHLRGVTFYDKNNIPYFQPYGALFDGPAALLIYLFQPADDYLFRHYLNALVGLAGLIFAGLISREITGKWSAALLTLALFVITPRYWGECFNNPKDIPFATATLLFILALFRWMKNIGTLRWPHTLLLGIALALPLCIRPGGLLFIGYFLSIAGILFLANRKLRTPKFCLHIVVAFIIGYFGCIFFWPQAFLNPVLAPFLSFKSQSKYLVTIRVLFEGQFMDCKNLPWYYIHKLLLITLPLVVLAGFLGSLVLPWIRRVPLNRTYFSILLFFTLFPLFSMIIRGSVFYDGIRQLLFVVALILICAAIGLWQLLRLLPSGGGRTVGLLAIAGGAALPVRYAVANHPNEYIYYNELVGGVKGAFSNYELDYYYNSVRQAYDWLYQHEGPAIRAAKDSLTLGSDCAGHIYYHYNRVGKLPVKVAEVNLFSQHKTDWDYAIFITRYLDHDALKNGYFNSPKSIHTITADGVPICMVLKNDTARYGYKAHLAKQAGRLNEAAAYLGKALAQYPGDVELWTDLTLLYMETNELDKAEYAINNALKISSVNHNSVHLSWEIAFRKQDLPKALQILTFATNYYKGTDAPWLRLAEAQALTGDLPGARLSIDQAIRTGDVDEAILARVKHILSLKNK